MEEKARTCVRRLKKRQKPVSRACFLGQDRDVLEFYFINFTLTIQERSDTKTEQHGGHGRRAASGWHGVTSRGWDLRNIAPSFFYIKTVIPILVILLVENP